MSSHEIDRRYVRDPRTGMYLQHDGQWTKELASATSWPSLSRLHEACREFGLTNVEIVVKFEGGDDCIFPL